MDKIENGLSVIVCCYAGKETITACLNSLSCQKTMYPFEVIIVDDGSVDGTKDVALEWIAKYKGEISFQHHSFDNRGLSYARNRGIKIAKFAYVAFIDEDAIADNKWVQEILTSFEEYPEVNTLGGDVKLLNNDNQTAVWIYYIYIVPYMSVPSSIIGTNMSFKRSFLLENNGFVTDFTYRGDETVFFKKSAANLSSMKNSKIVVYHEQPESIRRWLTIRFENGYFGAAADLYSNNLVVPPVIIKYILTLLSVCLIVSTAFYSLLTAILFAATVAAAIIYRRVYGSKKIMHFNPSIRLILMRYIWDILGEIRFIQGFIGGYLKYRKYRWEKKFEF